MPSKKSWRQKLAGSKHLPKVEKITDRMSKRWGTGTVVIPAPMEVDEIMRKVVGQNPCGFDGVGLLRLLIYFPSLFY